MESKQETNYYASTEDTYAIAAELSEQGFKEHDNIIPYDECDTIFINRAKNDFVFTTSAKIELTRSQNVKIENITLNTIEEWKTN